MLQLHKKWLSYSELMKPQKQENSFDNNQWFLEEAGTISSNYSRMSIFKCSCFLKPYCYYFFPCFSLIHIKERKRWMWLSHRRLLLSETLTEPGSGKGIILSLMTSLLVIIHSSKISIHHGGQAEAWTIFAKKLHRIYLLGSNHTSAR